MRLYWIFNRSPLLQRRVLKSIHHVSGGFGWNIANGIDVSLWFDAWLSNIPLCLLVDDIEPDEILWRVVDIIDDTGQWDIHCIRTSIPP